MVKIYVCGLAGVCVGGGSMLFGCGADSHSPSPTPREFATIEGSTATPAPMMSSHVDPSRPLPVVYFEQLDKSTALGQGPLGLRIENYGSPVGNDLLVKLAERTTLRTWPQLELVPTESIMVQDAPGAEGKSYANLSILPGVDLGEGWHALALGPLPDGLVWPPGKQTHSEDGLELVRFRSDSFPVVREVLVYEKSTGVYAAVISLSEGIVGDASLFQLAYAGAARIPCDTQPTTNGSTTGEGTGVTPVTGELNAGWFTSVELICEDALDFEKAWELQVKRGLSSRSGVELYGGDDVSLPLPASAWEDMADGGRRSQLEL